MRERRELNRSHLPESTYEAWLSEQSAPKTGTAHRNPSPDVYDTWVDERVRKRVAEESAGRKGRTSRAPT